DVQWRGSPARRRHCRYRSLAQTRDASSTRISNRMECRSDHRTLPTVPGFNMITASISVPGDALVPAGSNIPDNGTQNSVSVRLIVREVHSDSRLFRYYQHVREMSCTPRDEGHAPAVITRIVSVAALFCLGCSGNLTAATLTPLNGVYGLVSQSPERRWGAVVLIEIDSPGAISEVRISDFELFDDNDTVTRASSVVSVDEILRFRDGWERECGD